jgi:hypothetical protein
MKLATRRNGTRDGELVLVSRDLGRCVAVPEIARTLQAALDDWDRAAPALEAIAAELSAGRMHDAVPFDAALRWRPAARVPVGRQVRALSTTSSSCEGARRDDAAGSDRPADVPGRLRRHARRARHRAGR